MLFNKQASIAVAIAASSFIIGANGSILKRSLIDAGIHGSAEANLLGASADAYAGADGELLGSHVAAAAASEGAHAGILDLAGAGYDKDAAASILKRALIEAGIHGSAEANLLGASADAYAGADGSILGSHVAEAAASEGAHAGILGLAGAGYDKDAAASILKRALIDAGIHGSAEAYLLGASADAYAGADGSILGSHVAEAAASEGAHAGILGLAGAGYDKDAAASILKRAENSGNEKVELFQRFLDEAGYSGSDSIMEVIKRDDEEAEVMKRQLSAAFGPSVASQIIGEKREVAPVAGNRVAMVKRALIDAGIHGSAEANLLGASADAYAGADGSILGSHVAEAAASEGAHAGILGLAGAGYDKDAAASILKRALIDAGIHGSAEANLLGASADAYAGADGSILGSHVAEAAASEGAHAGILGLAGAGYDKDAAASILKRALIDAGIHGSAEANLLGASADAYAGADGELLGSHVAAAAASEGAHAGILDLAGAGYDKDAAASILKRALIDAGIHGSAEANLLGASADAYAGADGELLGSHVAAAAASEGAHAGILDLAGAGYDKDAAASILKRALIDAGIHGSAEANLLGASADAYAGADGELLGSHVAAAAASEGAHAGILDLAGAGYDKDAAASILKRALIDAGIHGSAEANILGASADAYAGADGSILGSHVAEAAASDGAHGDFFGLAGAGFDKDAAASIL